MSFSDAELSRLKFALENPAPNWVDKDNLTGLIARLEAAEAYAHAMRKGREGWFNLLYEAWRTAAGKGKP